MILQSLSFFLKPGSEVRTERQNSAGPQQRLTRVAVPGNAEAACASFGPLLSRDFFEPQKNVRGRLGNLPSAQDEWLSSRSLSLFLPSPSKPQTSLIYSPRRSREQRQPHFFVFLSRESSTPPVRGLSLQSRHSIGQMSASYYN